MKKTKRAIAICAGLTALAVSTSFLGACGGGTVEVETTEYELSCYKGDDKDTWGKPVYNTSLFYSNSLKQGYPDPQVFDDTAQSGYYYLYGTSNFQTMRSKDLAVWEYVKVVMDFSDAKEMAVMDADRWAPEVIYDSTDKQYYMFFSATPDRDNKTYNTITEVNGDVDGSLTKYCMYVAKSSKPDGPFKLVNFADENSCGEGNTHTLNKTTGSEITREQAESGNVAFVKRGETYYEAAFRQYYADYCLFAPDELSKLFYKNGVGTGGRYIEKPEARFFQTIDPHPYIAPDGKKYLYFKAENNALWNINVGVEMENWLKPKWETAKYITADKYYTIADWKEGSDDHVTYENDGYVCNEGAHMMYHEDKDGNGLYYFAFSVNDYSTSNYQVGIAVADSPLGDFRKLREYEGGLVLCSSTTDSESVSGAGHHSYVTIGNQTYIAYHRHRDYTKPSGDRYTAIDEIKWITVEDIDGNPMDVPYVNGPTDTPQPLPEKASGYRNVAVDATVICTDDAAELEYLTDGLLSVHKSADEDFMNYVQETKISKTSTVEFAFEKDTSVRAIMVYNSVNRKEIFRNVSKIEFTLADGSVRVIRDVKFDMDSNCRMGGVNGDEVLYVLSGASAFCEFYDVSVKNIKITVDVPDGQDKVGLSEIKILGKAEANA